MQNKIILLIVLLFSSYLFSQEDTGVNNRLRSIISSEKQPGQDEIKGMILSKMISSKMMERKPDHKDDLTNEELTEMHAYILARRGLTIDKIKKLKEEFNIDIIWGQLSFSIRDNKERTAISDYIIIGTVSNITYDSRREVKYHTFVYVNVEQYVKGKLDTKQIVIPRQSGPLKDHKGKEGSVQVSEEASFTLGEKVLLFLDHTWYEFSGRIKNYSNQPPEIYTNKNYFGLVDGIAGKHIIQENKINGKELSDFIKEIKPIIEITENK
jgi:hypothetical protein